MKATMGYERFLLLCNELGYDSKIVLGINFRPGKVTVIYIDQATNMPMSQDHEVVR